MEEKHSLGIALRKYIRTAGAGVRVQGYFTFIHVVCNGDTKEDQNSLVCVKKNELW